MELVTDKIKDKTIVYVSGGKYKTGKEKELKEALAAHGAINPQRYSHKPSDYVLIGQQHSFLNMVDRSGTLLFENEIIAAEPRELHYFKDFEKRFYDALRVLYKQKIISLGYLSLGKGMTEDEFKKIEKKTKQKIPAAVKEFYSIFGHLQLLWNFDRPSFDGYRRADRDMLCIHSGQHQGSINILPLKKVMENWSNPPYSNPPEGIEIKVFDFYSEPHQLAFHLSGDDDPIVYSGDDHGAGYNKEDLRFSEYINMLPGIYCYLNRFLHLQLWTSNEKDYLFTPENIKIATEGYVSIDFSNKREVDRYIKGTWENINDKIKQGKYEEAYEKARWFTRYDKNVFYTILDLATLLNDEEDYFGWLEAVVEEGLDLENYEKTSEHRKFLDSENYPVKKAGYLKTFSK